jgi:hypothetical protein
MRIQTPTLLCVAAVLSLFLAVAACSEHAEGDEGGADNALEPKTPQMARGDAGDATPDRTPQPEAETSTVWIIPVKPPQPSVVVTVTPPGARDGGPP